MSGPVSLLGVCTIRENAGPGIITHALNTSATRKLNDMIFRVTRADDLLGIIG
jgi:hypothetical protein